MKLTKSYLKQLIREELSLESDEAGPSVGSGGPVTITYKHRADNIVPTLFVYAAVDGPDQYVGYIDTSIDYVSIKDRNTRKQIVNDDLAKRILQAFKNNE